ncbi:hypothetical protein D3C87_1296240 [compost metagenome]|jgi:hypothetical protein
MWQQIWNGPFFIGKLSQPVSVGDAIMKVLETLWRTAVLTVLAIAALIAWVYVDGSIKNRRNAEALKSVVADAGVNAACNPGEFAVVIRNNSKYRLTYAEYRVEMTLQGRDVTPSHLSDLWTASDIPRGQKIVTCHSTAWDKYGASTTYRTQEGTVLGATVNRVTAE